MNKSLALDNFGRRLYYKTFLKIAQAGGGANVGHWFSFIFSLTSSALDHLATATPFLCYETLRISLFTESVQTQGVLCYKTFSPVK